MESMREFEARLKHTQSRARVRTQRVYVPDDAEAQVIPRGPWPLPIIVTCAGLALIAGLLAFARDDIARLFALSPSAHQISSLQPLPRPPSQAIRHPVSLTAPLHGSLDQFPDRKGL